MEHCALVGKAKVDVGQTPVAFIQMRQGAKATIEDIKTHTNSQVAACKKIREVKFLDAIPVSPAGKILKRELREMP